MKEKSSAIIIFNARTIGTFFLLAFLAYGLGRQLFESTNDPKKYLGALLIIANSVIVLFIGILLKKTLKLYNPLVGNIYLFTRIFEALVLSTIFINETVSDDLEYVIAMLILGIGSIPMCLTLYKHKISPAWLAIWGAIGYAVFAFGFLMELFGKEWSMYLLGLGGLWEISFAFWLIVRGSKNVKQTTY
ncbi:MAG: DUF4386 domain-containing protein [Bacteroidales bacterium]|jgi:hypothetical protein|nr:DUF4386 domain-containing protein [Bacteroidales bacterium]